MDYQKITVNLIGNATQDGEVKEAKESGNPYGDFRLAVTTAKKAIALAKQKGRKALVQKMQGRVRLYRSRKIYIDPQLE